MLPQRRVAGGARRTLAALFALLAAEIGLFSLPADVRADELIATLQGPVSVVFDPANGCSDVDVPDTPARAFRDGQGRAVMFALHDVAHPLRGPDLDHLAIDCRSALDSPADPDPSHYADRLFVAATWTRDGTDVAALVHAEYHADRHGRCAASGDQAGRDVACWWNAILAYRSRDGGAAFHRAAPPVVAAAPFTQDVGQGRHRGFFEPSNMVGDGGHVFAFLSTTGWGGQGAGSCLFRTDDPLRPAGWRAWDGHGFTIRYQDPYRSHASPQPCAVIPPFSFAVNAVVRHAASGLWLAVLQASPTAEYPVDGFYTASSRDLLHWSRPRLLLAGRTLFSDWCRANGGSAAPGVAGVAGVAGVELMNYPSILDPTSASRNFDAVGATPFLYYAAIATRGCATGRRLLVRRPLEITLRRDGGEARR